MNATAEHTYTVAGTSVLDGVVTYRFTNSLKRAKVLEGNGHTDVMLMELPRAMVLKDAVAWLRANGVMGELPNGQRHRQNGPRQRVVVEAPQHDAHVVAFAAAEAERKRKAAQFVANMAAARAAARARRLAA